MTGETIVIMVSEDSEPIETTLEKLVYAYRLTVLRRTLETHGVPIWRQPMYISDCVKLLAELLVMRPDH